MSMNVGCPKCHKNNDDIGECLPDRACDNIDYECIYCGHTFYIGWTAEAEVRRDNLNPELLEKAE